MMWTLSDDAAMQHVLKVSDTDYRLIEMTRFHPERDSYIVYSDYISLTDYFNNGVDADEELSVILKSYGYDSVRHIRDEYGDMANQVMCECIFESQAQQLAANIRFTGTKLQCEAYIREFVNSNQPQRMKND